MPLNLCLHVQGSEQIDPNKRQEILDATSGFMSRDIFFTEGNAGSARPRAELMKRSAITPYVFVTDNDMVFQEGSIDRLYKFLTNKDNAKFGMVDLVHNYLRWHRRVEGTKVTCIPLNFDTQDVIEVDLIGAASILMRKEVALIPNLIDLSYSIGTWDFDLCMNVKAAGWKIATVCDRALIAINDKTYRPRGYKAGRVMNRLKVEGTKIFERKWGFSSEHYPNSPKKVEKVKTTNKQTTDTNTTIISRAIYNTVGGELGIGVLDENRLDLMQRHFINSLRSQTDPNFTLCVVVGKADNEATARIKALNWGDLNVQFIHTDGDLSSWKKSATESKNWGREIDNGCPEVIARNSDHPLTTIMARMDIDDWVAPGWVKHMKHMAVNKPESHFLINYQVIGQAPDGRLYRFFAPHNHARTSPFIALIQKTDPRISPYETVHLNMGRRFSTVYNVHPSYTFMVVHGGNRSNKLYPGDKFYGEFENHKLKPVETRSAKIISMKQPHKVTGTDWRARIARASLNN